MENLSDDDAPLPPCTIHLTLCFLNSQVKENGSEILIIIVWMALLLLSQEKSGLKSLTM